MPPKYKEFVKRCQRTVNVINKNDFDNYVALWNEKFPEHEIKYHIYFPRIIQIALLKKVHLYFKGGIYSDFDT
jgi:hypothetical protein